MVTVNKPIKLYAVRLFGSENNEYSVPLTVTDPNRVVLATKTGMFMSQLVQSKTREYHGFDVAFEPPVALKAGIQYSLQASIKGRPSWREHDGLPRVEHAGVTFFFANKAGEEKWHDTTVSQGQFPEFIFSVK